MKQSSGIFQTNRIFTEVEEYNKYNVVSLEKSSSNGFWGKRTDTISFIPITGNSYIIIHFNSVYVNSKPIHIVRDRTERIVYLE